MAGIEGLGREPRPDDEAVGRRIAGGDAQLEGRARESRLRRRAGERQQAEGARGGEPVKIAPRNAAAQIPAPSVKPPCWGAACEMRELGGTLCVSQTLPPITLPRPTVTRPSTVALA